MKRLLALLALGFAMLAGPALASNCPTYPFTLTNGQTADANQVMANFNSILTCANTTLVASPVAGSLLASGAAVFNLGFTPLDVAGSNSMTSTLALAAGTTTVEPLLFTTGSLLTAPVSGAVEWDGSNLYITKASGPTREALLYADVSNLPANSITAADIAQIGANTIIGNPTSSTANFSAISMPSCSATASALTWTTSTGIGCHTISNSGGTVTSITFSSPLTGGTITGSGTVGLGTVPVASGGTGVTTSTGTGSVVLSASPALTGTPTAPTQAAGNSSTRLATTAFANPSSSLGTSSYAELPGGMILEGGIQAVNSGSSAAVTLPMTCPTAVVSVNITSDEGTVTGYTGNVGLVSTSGFTIYNGVGAFANFYWQVMCY